MLGQLQPGSFSDPAAVAEFLENHDRYRTLTRLDEWKPMGSPQDSNMGRNAAQKMLVRRDGGNWEVQFWHVSQWPAELVGLRCTRYARSTPVHHVAAPRRPLQNPLNLEFPRQDDARMIGNQCEISPESILCRRRMVSSDLQQSFGLLR